MDVITYEHVANLGAKINVKGWADRLVRGDEPVAVLLSIQLSVRHYLKRRDELMYDD